jgi:hypothetical protein
MNIQPQVAAPTPTPNPDPSTSAASVANPTLSMNSSNLKKRVILPSILNSKQIITLK